MDPLKFIESLVNGLVLTGFDLFFADPDPVKTLMFTIGFPRLAGILEVAHIGD